MIDRRRFGTALVAAAVVLASAPAGVLAITPVDGGPLPVFLGVDIDTEAGTAQYDAHVDGDIAVYTSVTEIRYYDFATGDHLIVPTADGTQDQLSDISNGRIVFSRLDTFSLDTSVMVFDTGTNVTVGVDQTPGAQRSNGAIGGDTVAYIDQASSELYAAQLGVAGTVKVTSDLRIDRQPQVAPLGDLIVWESCELDSANCDIRQAAWDGSTWVVSALTDNADPEANADSNGDLVVFDATRGGERDIYWQPVGGGGEATLTLAGQQRNPSISAGVIAFESVPVGATAGDVYLYDLPTNRIFQITSTPSNETLSDVDVLSDGRVRLVWASGSGTGRDVYGATLELPPTGPSYAFGGFRSPVDARPTLNSVKAGAAVPVKFSLGGDEGPAIFATGYPRSDGIACDSTADVDAIEQTVAAGGSSLTFDPSTGLYTYVWKTEKAWAGTCRQLVLAFMDGSFARANFKLK